MELIQDWLRDHHPLGVVTLTALGAMLIGSAIRIVSLRSATPERRTQRLASLRTWWILIGLVLFAAWVGPTAITLLLAIASSLALDEFLKLTMPEFSVRVRRSWIALIVGTTYGLIALAPAIDFRAIVPLVIVASLVVPHLISDSPRRYLDHVGHALWGAIVLAWGVAHAAWLVARDVPASDPETRIGWFLTLVLLTEANDIAQAIVGRALGRHKILPTVSPHKTWEGLCGGLLITTLLAGALQFALQLAPLSSLGTASTVSPWLAMLGGLIIAGCGFIGDLNISCIKRDVGVKDGSELLPGMGGMVDRIDSLSFTAPVFLLWLAASS